MIKIQHLQKSFNNNIILKDINITLEAGRVYVLIAPNGTGKTTLISLLAGLMSQDSGDIVFDDETDKEELNIILSGERNLYMKNTVYENILYLCILKGMNKKEAKRAIEAEKDKFPIYEEVKYKLVETLSYGQKRLVALMSAAVTGARCIIIDEATDGLDVDNRKLLSTVIRSIMAGRIIFVVTHDFSFASQVADLLVFLKDGCLTDMIRNDSDCNIDKAYQELYE